jgi:branched-chain amino acid aminotransferase
MAFINYNKSIVPADLHVMSPGHRALRYGDGIFESMRMSEGKLLFADFHAKRLLESLQILNLELPFVPDLDFLIAEVGRLCSANNFESARVRLQVWREGEGLYAPSSSSASFCISAESAPGGDFTLSSTGLTLGVFDEQSKAFGTLSSLKSASALLYVMAAAKAKKYGWDDALIFNGENRIAETSSSNIWFVKNKEWFTPSLNEACVDGVMRRVLLSVLRNEGIKVTEASFTMQALSDFDFIILSNASRGLRWVKTVGQFTFEKPELSELLLALNSLARKY